MSIFVEFAQKNLAPLMPLVFVLVVLSQALLKAIKTFFIKPKINVYPTGPLSIGLSQLGSTLTLFGTLQVQRTDCFVTKMEAFVWNNSWSRTFEWRALQPYTFSLLPNQENLQLELVSAFLLTTQSPFKYNLVFVDDRLTKQCMPEVLKLRQRWEDAGQLDITAFMEKEEAVAHLLTRLQQEWYWQPGTYQLTLKIHTTRKIHEKTFQFELTKAQLTALQGNFTKLAKLICDQPVKFDKVKCEYHQGYSAEAA